MGLELKKPNTKRITNDDGRTMPLIPKGLAYDPKAGRFTKIVEITSDTLWDIQSRHNRMIELLKKCEKYSHNKRLDKEIGEFLSGNWTPGEVPKDYLKPK